MHLKHFIIACLAMGLVACATPAENFQVSALEYGFQEQVISGNKFNHKIYSNTLARSDSTEILHVYLDGDGSPWRNQYSVATDPTARNPLILALMQQDSHAGILLGRPCYYGLNHDLGCNESLWTEKRYAAIIVASMQAALQHWLTQHSAAKIVLIGYSGGGTLAALMAQTFRPLQAVVTFAANLDVDAWSLYHEYTVLSESLNPMRQPILASEIQQLHVAGAIDNNVPEFIIQNYASKQPHAQFISYPQVDHFCCWVEKWSEILTKIETLH